MRDAIAVFGGRPIFDRPLQIVRPIFPDLDSFERDTFSADVWRKDTEFRGSAFLAPRILCIDRGAGRAADTGVHQESGKGSQEKEDERLDQLNLWRQQATFRWPKT
jgi:hypothetical protein